MIRTDFSYDTLKVGEIVIPGSTDDTIVLCAHLCHPGMVNDDLTGVAVAIDVARRRSGAASRGATPTASSSSRRRSARWRI